MSPALRHLAIACLMTSLCGAAWSQARSIYTCTDAKGRRITSDRPIAECFDREQKELNPSGTFRRSIGPNLTASERAAQEERDRKAAEERQRQAEEQRMQKLLVARYPNAAVHEAERTRALRAVEDAIASGHRRTEELRQQRRALTTETEFYKSPTQWPPKLKRQLDENDEQAAAQQRFIAAQEDEKTRITRRFDEELARLKLLWAQQSPGLAAASAASGPAAVR
jgi:hypothetical protein